MCKTITHIFTLSMTPSLFMRSYFLFFKNNGYQIQVVAGADSFFDDFSNFCDGAHIELVKAPYSRRPNFFKIIRSLVFTLFFILKSTSNIFVVHTPFASFVVSLVSMLSLRRFDFVFYCHGLVSYDSSGFRGGVLKLLEKFIFYQASSVVFVSNSLKDYAVEYGYLDPSKVIHTSGSICGVVSNSSQPRKFPSLPIRLGYFGRIAQSKGAFDCFKVAHLLESHNIPFEMHFAGTVEDEDKFFSLFSRSANCFFHGFVNSKDGFFSNIDILLMPSRREGFGMSALEANSYCLPVIGYDIVGLRDCVENNVTGFLVSPKGDYAKMVDCILFYLSNPSLYELHSANSKLLAFERYSQNKVLNDHYSAIRMLNI